MSKRSVQIRVFFQLSPGPFQEWEGPAMITELQRLWAQGSSRYGLAERPEEADFVIFPEANYFKTRDYAGALRAVPEIQQWPEKCFTFNIDDAPLPFLRGVYAALPGRWAEEGRTVAGGYITGSPNPFCAEYEARRFVAPEWLFSFRGARSALVRDRIFAQALELTRGFPASIQVSTGWFNHSETEMRRYLDEIIRSRFVLCPRGQGATSHRLFEVMRLGRVPVIISDAWLPPRGPRWETFSLRVRERDVGSLRALILEREADFPAMGAAARAAWEHWYSPEKRLWVMLDELAVLPRETRESALAAQRRWDQARFYRANLGTFGERVRRRLRRIMK